MWADSAAVPSEEGFILPDIAPTTSCGMAPLGSADGTPTYRFEFPEGTSLRDIAGGSLSVWCRAFGINFGDLVIPEKSALVDLATTADGPELQCSTGADMSQYADESSGMEIGSFVGRAHDVAGDVYVLSDRVLEIKNFVYDGTAPDAFFWIGGKPVPSEEGVILSDAAPSNSCGSTKLGYADGSTSYRVEFPEGTTIHNFTGGSLSIWCRAFGANFGELIIPDNLQNIPRAADGPDLECSELDDGEEEQEQDVMTIVETPEGYNCESLHEDMQVRWKIEGGEIFFELVGFIEDDNYLSFGVSGSDERTEMIGADVIIGDLFNGEFRASPYVMNARSQCSNGAGVCADEGFSTNVSGARDEGITVIRYSRPLVATELTVGVDRNISVVPGESTHIAWAIGPVSADTGFPNFHSVAFPREDVAIEFGRAVTNNCEPLVFMEEPEEEAPVEAFKRPVIKGITELHASIGPSGGDRGYQAISGGRVGWGIAWYVNDLLLPVIEMERGTTYTFLVNGGNVETDSANYHPMYLTTSISGGYAQIDDAERADEQIFKGLTFLEGGIFEATALAPICKYSATESTQDTLANGTYSEFFSTLEDSCRDDATTVAEAARLEFTPDANTPDLLYYQCVTHRNLGWEIRIVDPPESLAPAAQDVAELETTEVPPVEETPSVEALTVEDQTQQPSTSVTRDKIEPEKTEVTTVESPPAEVSPEAEAMVVANPSFRGSEISGAVSIVSQLGLTTAALGVLGFFV